MLGSEKSLLACCNRRGGHLPTIDGKRKIEVRLVGFAGLELVLEVVIISTA